jgi:hypothetical protein
MKEPEATDRVLIAGKAHYDRCDNKVKSARYTLFTFFPKVRCCRWCCFFKQKNQHDNVEECWMNEVCKNYSPFILLIFLITVGNTRTIPSICQSILLRGWMYYVFRYLYTLVR